MPMLWEPKIITFKVRDYDAVRSFYKAILALRILEEDPNYSVTFELGSLKLRLEKHDLGDLPENFGRSCELVFNVRSTKDIIEVLEKLNVEYSIEAVDDQKLLAMVDPEGRMITLRSKY